MNNLAREFAKLIHAAIERKYGSRSLKDVRVLVIDALEAFRQTTSVQSLLRRRRPTADFESDVVNQTRCLYAIEAYWRFTPPRRTFVQKVHAISYGTLLADVNIRKDSFVPDYGGIVPWATRDIGKGLSAIATELSRVAQFANASARDKGLFVAELFSMLIRVHPFQDGNGRTARMLVQYCLRFWGDDYIVVPKVRNSKDWKDRLDRGVHGDVARLGKYFETRIIPREERMTT